MKKQFLMLMMSCTVMAYSQPGGGTASLLDVPVLTGGTTASTVQPTLGPICFDKKIKIISNAGGRQLETCLFLNTRMGIIGYFSDRPGETGTCAINPMTDNFRFTVMTLKGNTYQYLTNEKRGRLEHRVVTHNSDFYYTPLAGRPGSGGTGTMRKLNESGSYAGGRITTAAYQAPGSPVRFHLYGTNLPAQINVTGTTKHLGMFGVGYSTFGNKVYLVMEMINNGESISAITSIENTDVCFNSEIFGVFEDEFYTKTKNQIQQQRQKILNDYSISSSPCAGMDLTIKNYKLESLDRQEAYLEKTRQGNSLEDKPTQQAMANLFNYDDQIQIAIYEQEKRICKLQADQGIQSRRLSADDYELKLRCYNRQLTKMNQVKAEMATVASRFANSPGMQMTEKAKLMLQAMVGCD
jgi:hypothetical protein